MDGPWNNEAEFRTWLSKCETMQEKIYYTVIDNKTGRALGAIALLDIQPKHGNIEVGSIFFSPEMQRTSFSTEAIYLLAQYAFDTLGYQRFIWKCNDNNIASKSTALRFGFLPQGIWQNHMIVKDQVRDTAWFAITKNAWPERRRACEQWLQPDNFSQSGEQKSKLSELTKNDHYWTENIKRQQAQFTFPNHL